METKTYTIKNNLPLIIGMRFSILFVSVFIISSNIVLAQTNNPVITYDNIDSMYKYNALENKISFSNTTNTTNVSIENNLISNIPEITPQNTEINIPIQKNIMEEVNNITVKYNYSKQQIDDAMNRIKNRTTLGTILLGTDLKVLKFQVVQLKDQIYELKTLALKTNSTAEKNQIDIQNEQITQEENGVENFILVQQNKFSFFGWFVSIL